MNERKDESGVVFRSNLKIMILKQSIPLRITSAFGAVAFTTAIVNPVAVSSSGAVAIASANNITWHFGFLFGHKNGAATRSLRISRDHVERRCFCVIQRINCEQQANCNAFEKTITRQQWNDKKLFSHFSKKMTFFERSSSVFFAKKQKLFFEKRSNSYRWYIRNFVYLWVVGTVSHGTLKVNVIVGG
jgi:hypothetical protein